MTICVRTLSIFNWSAPRLWDYGAFKSSRIDRIYELKAHERHHKVVIMSGKLEIFFKPRVSELGACQWNNVSDAMDATKN